MNWALRPRIGIECDFARISFGDTRSQVRHAMSNLLQLHESDQFPDEDDYRNSDDSIWIRVRYEDDMVGDIEILQGSLRYEGLELHNMRVVDVQDKLRNRGLVIRPAEWLGEGFDCVTLGVNIASQEDVGGSSDQVEWVILSKRFTE